MVAITVNSKELYPSERLLQDILTKAIRESRTWADVTRVVQGKSADFFNAKDADEGGTVGLETIALGMQRVLSPGFKLTPESAKRILDALASGDASRMDDVDADNIVQAALFNSIRYG